MPRSEDEPDIHDVIDLAYQKADEADAKGDTESADGCRDIGRQWYLIQKRLLGVELDESEQREWNEFLDKHLPPNFEG